MRDGYADEINGGYGFDGARRDRGLDILRRIEAFL
jgi:hypothetical protein